MNSARNARRLSVSALALAVFIGNASTYSQTHSDSADAQVRKFDTCQLAVYNAPEFDPIRPHIPRNVFQATTEQLSDTSLPTDDEIRAILQLHPRSRTCYDEFLNGLAQSAPSLALISARRLTKTQDSLVDLLERKQGWGDHILRSREAALAWRADRNTIPVAGEDIAQQQAALSDALSDFRRTQDRFDSLRSP